MVQPFPFSGKTITIYWPNRENKSGYEISTALITDDADTKALIQQYGGLVEVLVDPSSGGPSQLQAAGPGKQLFNYQRFKDGGCYMTARPMSLVENVVRLKGVISLFHLYTCI